MNETQIHKKISFLSKQAMQESDEKNRVKAWLFCYAPPGQGLCMVTGFWVSVHKLSCCKHLCRLCSASGIAPTDRRFPFFFGIHCFTALSDPGAAPALSRLTVML
jgi:hypothetical protein